MPAATPGLRELFHTFDGLVLDAGGRHYLAKDAHMTPDAVRRGYPRLDEWRAIRAAVDPPACGSATSPAASASADTIAEPTMDNALGEPQTIVLLGGTSDIGRAIVARLCRRPRGRSCSPGGDRRSMPAGELDRPGVTVDAVAFDATDAASTRRCAPLVADHGDLDVVVLAFGAAREQAELDADPARAAELVTSTTPAPSAPRSPSRRSSARQGHGRLVVLSSVAGERVRKANFVYGSSKAGLDGFAQGLGDALAGTGASVLVVRPGFVHSRMTAGMKAAPFATTPAAVADATVKALARGPAHGVGAGHAALRVQRLPPPARPVWRRLPLG